MLELYGFARVNKVARGNTRDLRVLWALEEMALPFEIKGIDHPAHELDTSEFRAMNPFGQIPVIDDDGIVLSESGAILIYLARKSGTLIPDDLAGEGQVPLVVRVTHHPRVAAAVDPVHRLLRQGARSVARVDGAARTSPAVSPRGLARRPHVDRDRRVHRRRHLAAHVLFVNKNATLLAPYPRVLAYRDRCKARPAWQRVFDAYCERVEAA